MTTGGPLAATSGLFPGMTDREELMADLLQISKEMVTLSLDKLIQRSLDLAERKTGSSVGFYHFVDEDQVNISLQGWSSNTIANMCRAQGKKQHYPINQAGIWADCIRSRSPITINDYANLPGKHGMPDGHAQISRMISVPLMRDGLVRAIIGLGNKNENYSDRDTECIQEIMSVMFFLIEHKRNEEQMARAQKAEGLGRMAGAIAHNFNNMMAAVIGNLELSLKTIPAGSEAYDLVVSAMQSARNASGLSGNMLAYLGQAKGEKEPVNLVPLIEKVLEDKRYWHSGSAVVSLEVSHQHPVILGDEDQIRSALMEFMRNASEAIGPAAGLIKVGITTIKAPEIPYQNRVPFDFHVTAAEYACLTIEDSGCGIDATEIDKLFDPFYTTKFNGRGLGLATALGIVRRAGGCVCVSSIKGQGSVFRVYIPQSVSQPGPKMIPHTVAATSRPDSRLTGRILLVDDDPAVRTMTASMLRYIGLSVVEAENGLVAMEVFQREPEAIDCLLSDLTMPHMDGWETLERVRAIRPGFPAVIASGYDREQILESARSEMPQAFLAKPFDLAGLREALTRAMLRE